MKPQEFIELVAKMRSAQKAYFRTRNYADLDLSKQLERQVDNALRQQAEDDTQYNLFNT